MSKQPKMSVCRNCNAPIGKNARICPSCGAKNTKPFYQKWWFVLLIIIIIISLIGSMNRNKKEKFDWNLVINYQNQNQMLEQLFIMIWKV